VKTFKALVVDDEPGIRAEAEEVFSSNASSRIFTAASLKEAQEIILNEFLHVAFIDMQLDEDRASNTDGKTILRELVEVRPSCKRFLLTQYPDKYRRDFFALLHPLNPIIHGALDKRDFGNNFANVLTRFSSDWLAGEVQVSDCGAILNAFAEKHVELESPKLTSDEIDYLVSTLLGQGYKHGKRTKEDIDRISFSFLGKGRSRSIVVLGRPYSEAGQQGIYCVIKLGLRRETEEESIRYRRYVRFLVSLNRRVELLDFISGDALAAVCYSFGGRSPESIFSLGDLFACEDSKAITVVDDLFRPETKEWYANHRVDRDMAGFFYMTYDLDANNVLEEVIRFAEEIAPQCGGNKVGSSLRFGGDALALPEDVLGASSLRAAYEACIVHGDLNAENVIISDDGRVICIDYRYTGWGPKTLDFAALQASIRLSKPVLERSLQKIVADHRIEKEVWKSAWYDTSDYGLESGKPYWARLSHYLLRKVVANFEGLLPEEHAATCLLLALRLFRVRSLSKEARLRLLVWMSSLSNLLKDSRKIKQIKR
jgi:hypothetical protein